MKKAAGAIGLVAGLYLATGVLSSILLPTYPYAPHWLVTLCSRIFESSFVTLFGKW